MTESEAVKMAVVLVPMAWIAVVLLIGGIAEAVKNYRNRDLFKDEEAMKLLRHTREEE